MCEYVNEKMIFTPTSFNVRKYVRNMLEDDLVIYTYRNTYICKCYFSVRLPAYQRKCSLLKPFFIFVFIPRFCVIHRINYITKEV